MKRRLQWLRNFLYWLRYGITEEQLDEGIFTLRYGRKPKKGELE